MTQAIQHITQVIYKKAAAKQSKFEGTTTLPKYDSTA